MASAQYEFVRSIDNGATVNETATIIAALASGPITKLTTLDPTGFSQMVFGALGAVGVVRTIAAALDSEATQLQKNSINNGGAILEDLADFVASNSNYASLEATVFFNEYTDPQTGETTRLVHGNTPGTGTDNLVTKVITTSGDEIDL